MIETQTESSADITSKQVLVVEDDSIIRRMLQKFLEHWGYRTLAAPDGEKALEIAKQHGGDIDVLLSDVTMPGMSGQELAEKLTGQLPSLKVILISGYCRVRIALRRGWIFIQKPFRPEAIKEALEK